MSMEAKKEYKACAKYLMISPSKVRPVADLVRRKPYYEAVGILEALPHKGSRLILKVLQSAVANATFANRKLDEEQLFVSQLLVDDGPRLKRVWARSHGKRDILLKRMSHITVAVSERAGK
ncbi:MAG: 50S ribosomal protein L22 [Sphaerochaetaceae bacterium]